MGRGEAHPLALDTPTPRSRRALLTAAAAATVATVAEAVVRPLPVAAAGDDGATVTVGGFFPDARAQTTLANTANDNIVLYVASNADAGHGGGTAIGGFSDHGSAIVGSSTSGQGVRGQSASGNGVSGFSNTGGGVYGNSSSSDGVRGISTTGYGVLGVSTTNIGVYGGSSSNTAVFGESSAGNGVSGRSDDGIGVRGSSSNNIGVYGASLTATGVSGRSQAGTGVRAETVSGTALDVQGKAHFSRSGRKTILAGHSTVTVYLGGTTTSSKVFAVLASNRASRYVRAVVPASGSFKVYLNASVGSNSAIAWSVLD